MNGYGRAIYYTADSSSDGSKINYETIKLTSVSEGWYVKGRRSGKTRIFSCETGKVEVESKRERQ